MPYSLTNEQAETPLFCIESLSFRYPDGRWALKGIDLSIYPGDRLALVGPNGSGKTTLIRHLNGLCRGQSSRFLYKGRSLENAHLHEVRSEVGILFDDPDDHLFCNTLYEDVAFGPMNQGCDAEEVDRRVHASLERVGLAHLMFKAPHHLSYGQRKRAAFAAVLAMEPEVLVLDEPTANLDPKQERIFIDVLREYQGTLICISHDLLFLYCVCSRAVVLEEGTIRHDYTMDDLLSNPDSLRAHGLDFTFRFKCCTDHRSVPPSSPSRTEEPPVSTGIPSPEKTLCAGTEPVIRLENYGYRYADGTWGIRGIDLLIGEGERIAVVGENGAGKSTLALCLAGVYRGVGGYRFQGKSVTEKMRKQLWRNVGIVFQDSSDQLFCASCREEVGFGPRCRGWSSREVEKRVKKALQTMRLEGYEERVPHRLSSGEQKRLAIAAVLAMEPEVLILDEPTAALDPHSEELLLQVLDELRITLILISHDMFFISRLSERTLMMHQGRIVGDYSTAEFLKDDRLLCSHGLDYTFKNDCCRKILEMYEWRSHLRI